MCGMAVDSAQFTRADDFWRGLGTVYVCGRYLSIDAAGILHPLRVAVEGTLEPYRKDTKLGFVDQAGRVAIQP